MLKLMQRICWNTRGWRLPSGATYEGGFPGEKGFGHEEWNFQMSDEYNGYMFPYTYKIPQITKLNDNNGIFSIGFFSIHPETKNSMMIGIHHDAELITDDEYPEIIKHFEKSGIFERRANELLVACDSFKDYESALEEVRNGFKEKWIRVKCKLTNVEQLSIPLIIPKPASHRFSTFSYVDNFPELTQNNVLEIEKPSALAEDGYYRESSAKLKVIIPKHNILSNKFCNWLKEKEIMPVQEKDFIDIFFKFNNNSFIAELKIVYGINTTKAIRESIGQLIEYNHYPGRIKKDNWLIVLDEKPIASDFKYVEKIKEELGLPLCLIWEENDDFEIFPKKSFGL